MQIEVRQWIERYQGCDEAGDPIVNGRANGFHEQIYKRESRKGAKTQRSQDEGDPNSLRLCAFA
jgi:hypothetical protein